MSLRAVTVSALVIAAAVTPLFALAQLEAAAGASVTATASTSVRFQERKAEVRERAMEIKDDLRAMASTSGAAVSQELSGIRAKARADLAATRQAFLERMRTMRAKLVADARTEHKKTLDAKAKVRVEAFLNSVKGRFDVIVSHLENVSQRIEDRISELESRGYKLENGKKALAEADAKLEAAKKDVVDVKAQLSVEINKETSRETLRALVGTAKESLKEARAAYVDALQAIREEVKAQKDSAKPASTTPEAE